MRVVFEQWRSQRRQGAGVGAERSVHPQKPQKFRAQWTMLKKLRAKKKEKIKKNKIIKKGERREG